MEDKLYWFVLFPYDAPYFNSTLKNKFRKYLLTFTLLPHCKKWPLDMSFKKIVNKYFDNNTMQYNTIQYKKLSRHKTFMYNVYSKHNIHTVKNSGIRAYI